MRVKGGERAGVSTPVAGNVAESTLRFDWMTKQLESYLLI